MKETSTVGKSGLFLGRGKQKVSLEYPVMPESKTIHKTGSGCRDSTGVNLEEPPKVKAGTP